MAVFWVVAPCSLVEVYQRFSGPCCLQHQGYIRAIALTMETARTSETLVNFYQTTQCYNPEDSHLHKQFNLCNCEEFFFLGTDWIFKSYEDELHASPSSTSVLAPLFILPNPLPNALSSLNLPLPEGRAGTDWGPS
jgi:hypothetical protein